MKFVFFILYSLGQYCNASLLLVPSSEIVSEKYWAYCTKPDYICTTDYFLEFLQKRGSPQFDQLIDSVDLGSIHFINEFQNKIIGILNTEELDRTRFAMLLDLIKKTNSIKPTLFFKLVENELVRLQAAMNSSFRNATGPRKKEFIYIFKEIIALEDAVKIRTTFLKIPLYIINFSQVPYKTNTFDFKRIIQKPLLAGPCGPQTLTYKTKTAKLCLTENKSLPNSDETFTKERPY